MQARIVPLTTPEEVDRFLAQNPVAVIFKAGTCHKTMWAWGNLEAVLRVRPGIPVGVIRVVEHRPASNRVAERTGIVHHSPQVILFREGQPLFERNNWEVELEALEELFRTHLPDWPLASPEEGAQSDLEPYLRLLDAYLAGVITEEVFTWSYLKTLKEDASLHPKEVGELLHSLFGNPDAPHVHPVSILRFESENPSPTPLKERARALKEALLAYTAPRAEG